MKKTGIIANFNCTFGRNAQPLLSHFLDIFYPALKDASNKYIRINSNNKYTHYIIQAINIHNYNGNLVLSGVIIKNTLLIIESQFINHHLRSTDIKQSAAPYSFFQIFLKNHRMVFVRNQVGSPTINNFEKVIRRILHQYVDIKRENNKEKYPTPELNIIPIESNKKISEMLKGAYKINKIDFNLKPLNQQIDTSPLLKKFRDAINKYGTKTNHISMTLPDNKSGIAKLVSESNGKTKCTIQITDKNKNKRTIKNENGNKYTTKNVAISWKPVNSIHDLFENLKNVFKKVKNDPIIRAISTRGLSLNKIRNSKKYYDKVLDYVNNNSQNNS